ncbi:MAG: hypothetical protein F6K09_23255 [Merismopedia sp. SIO2A8]|nr:hypothetical protein [Symploca sp. SIO2B6]NET51524.1 hypothetical protein [Merismopedia sp. SIO2A8]
MLFTEPCNIKLLGNRIGKEPIPLNHETTISLQENSTSPLRSHSPTDFSLTEAGSMTFLATDFSGAVIPSADGMPTEVTSGVVFSAITPVELTTSAVPSVVTLSSSLATFFFGSLLFSFSTFAPEVGR